YFPTKRDLLLYTLQPDVLNERCQNFFREHKQMAAEDPRRFFDLYVDFAVRGVRLWQPAIQASLELGVETFWGVLDWALNLGAEGFRDMKRIVAPGISEEALDQLEYSLRRAVLAACLDKRITSEALRKEIFAIFEGYGAEEHRQQISEVPVAVPFGRLAGA